MEQLKAIPDTHFVLMDDQVDFFRGKVDYLREQGCTVVDSCEPLSEDEDASEIWINGEEYTFDGHESLIQGYAEDIDDTPSMNCRFQYSKTAIITLYQGFGYRGAGNYDVIIQQDNAYHYVDVVSEGMVYLLRKVK